MKEQAIAKLKVEMEADKTNGNLQGAGELLIQYLNTHPEAAAAIITEGTSLKKACQVMHDEARRRAGRKGSFWMSDADGLAMILEYFGIKAADSTPGPVKPEPTASAFDIDLDELLEL